MVYTPHSVFSAARGHFLVPESRMAPNKITVRHISVCCRERHKRQKRADICATTAPHNPREEEVRPQQRTRLAQEAFASSQNIHNNIRRESSLPLEGLRGCLSKYLLSHVDMSEVRDRVLCVETFFLLLYQ